VAKKKKHWSAILKVLRACKAARRWAAKRKTMQDAWRECKHGAWMEWLADIISYRYNCKIMMWAPAGMNKTKKANTYWENTDDADLIRKLWPKPPRIPKKLLKEAGLA
jgi:hypothetical protein